MSSDDHDRRDRSAFVDLARGLLGGGEPAEELEKEIDRLAPNASGGAIDDVLSSTMLGLADVRAGLEAAADQHDGDKPLVQLRERELTDGRVAVRAFVTDPDARCHVSDRSVLLRGEGWEDEQLLGFEPGGVERVDHDGDGTVAEFLIEPAAEPIETDYPPEEDDEDDEDPEADEPDEEDDDGAPADPPEAEEADDGE